MLDVDSLSLSFLQEKCNLYNEKVITIIKICIIVGRPISSDILLDPLTRRRKTKFRTVYIYTTIYMYFPQMKKINTV